MPDLISSLNVINVASPCPANWDDMTGDDRKRFCGQCNLHVYNLSDMPEADALKLVNAADGRLCIRFFRREDGTMLTRDCPVGLRAVRMKFARMFASAAAMLGAVTLSSFFGRAASGEGREGKPVDPKPLVALKELKGEACVVAPTKTLDKLGAVEIVRLLKTARERDAKLTGSMPDPLDPEVILESERQSLESRISAKDWKCPTPGTKEYETLMKQLTSALKQHPDLMQPIVPTPVTHTMVLGKMVAPVRKIEIVEEDERRLLPE